MIPLWMYTAIPFAVAFLLAVGLSVAAVLQYRVARAVTPRRRVGLLLAVIAAGALATAALTPRNLDERDLGNAARILMADFDESFAASRYLTLVIVGTGFIELVRGWIAQRAAPRVDPARPVLMGLVAYYVGTILIQAFGSEHLGFDHRALYLPIVLLAVYYQQLDDLGTIVRIAKVALFMLMATSLLGIAVRPDFVLHRPEPGVIPGVDFRLFGLAPHANALGPAALVGMMLVAHSPSRSWLLNAAQLLAAGAVFLLAQSKTAWVAGCAIVLLVVVPLGFGSSAIGTSRATRFTSGIVTLLVCLGATIAATLVVAGFDIVDYVERNAQLATLTGRTQIWDLTLQGWRENELFGYGPEIWGAERVLKFRMFHVGQAHNQVVQTLGEAGLFGLALLLAYLGTIAYAALRGFWSSRGLTFGLLILVLARCVTEAPLRVDGILTWPTFTNVLLIVFACHHLRAGVRAPRGGPALPAGRRLPRFAPGPAPRAAEAWRAAAR